MFRIALATAAVAAALVGSSAFAADLIVDDVVYDPQPVATNWTGFYVGGFVGGRVGNIDNTDCDGICLDDIALNGLTAGVTAGYDYQFDDNWVIGAFVTLPLLKPTTTAEAPTPPFPADTEYDIDPQWAVAGGVRAGFASGNVMPYLLAGIAAANVTVTPNMNGTTADTNTHVGAILGGGVEYKIDENLSVDGRYQLGLLNSQEYEFAAFSISSYSEISHNFTIGLNYKF